MNTGNVLADTIIINLQPLFLIASAFIGVRVVWIICFSVLKAEKQSRSSSPVHKGWEERQKELDKQERDYQKQIGMRR